MGRGRHCPVPLYMIYQSKTATDDQNTEQHLATTNITTCTTSVKVSITEMTHQANQRAVPIMFVYGTVSTSAMSPEFSRSFECFPPFIYQLSVFCLQIFKARKVSEKV